MEVATTCIAIFVTKISTGVMQFTSQYINSREENNSLNKQFISCLTKLVTVRNLQVAYMFILNDVGIYIKLIIL